MLRAALLTLGLAFGANAVWLAITANLNLGTALVAVVAFGLIAAAAWLPLLTRVRWLAGTALVAASAVFVAAGLLAIHGTGDDARFDEDAVIVLGAAVHGTELSNTLAGRLVVALDYHRSNPDAVIVVSGGQGPQEDLPEAVAMRRFLLDHGVGADQIVVEDRSTSTEENFAFSKALLDERLAPGYPVVFVTDEFHVFRAGRIAAALGLDARHVSSRTPWYFWPANYLRELGAIATSGLSR